MLLADLNPHYCVLLTDSMSDPHGSLISGVSVLDPHGSFTPTSLGSLLGFHAHKFELLDLGMRSPKLWSYLAIGLG